MFNNGKYIYIVGGSFLLELSIYVLVMFNFY